jgi:2-octaprenyl-6-methoxyphenol hydroxylase
LKQYVVVGGGIIGLSLVLELINKVVQKSDIVTLITPEDIYNPQTGYNSNKVIALSDVNYEFFVNMGIKIEANKINAINMIDGADFCKINASNINLSCLGYCISWQDIYKKLCEKIIALKSVQIIQNKIEQETDLLKIVDTAHHVFLCDGGNIKLSGTKFYEHDYKQDIVICRGDCNQYVDGEAFEFFTDDGALAILPHKKQVVCLFSLSHHKSQELISNVDYLHQNIKKNISNYLEVDFNNKDIVCYPLKLRYLSYNPYSKITFLGNAAHTIHPIMAQGLNLGLKNLQLLIKILNVQGISGIESYHKISKINIIKTSKFIHYLALYSTHHNKFNKIRLLKSTLWHTVSKLHLMQKALFMFLQY